MLQGLSKKYFHTTAFKVNRVLWSHNLKHVHFTCKTNLVDLKKKKSSQERIQMSVTRIAGNSTSESLGHTDTLILQNHKKKFSLFF